MTKTPQEHPPEDFGIDDDAPPKFGLRKTVELTCAFLWFYRRIPIAAALILGVGYGLYLSTQEKATPTETSSSNSQKYTQPQAEISLAEFSAANDPNQEDQKSTDLSQTSSLLSIIKRSDKNELLDYSLNVQETWQKVSPSTAVVMLSDRLKVIKRLLKMELSETERLYSITSYIETASILDALNTQNKLGLLGTREAVLEIERIFSNHKSPPVSGKANLAYVMIPGYDFVTNPSISELKRFQERLKERGATIFADFKSTSQLAEISLIMQRHESFRAETKAVAIDILERIRGIPDDRYQSLAIQFAEKIYFGELDPIAILRRIPADDEETRADVDALFSGLDATPDAQIGFYSTAASIIRLYIRDDKLQEAERLTLLLQRIAAKNSNEKDRDKAFEYVEILKNEIREATPRQSPK